MGDRGVGDDVALMLDDSCDDGDTILVVASANHALFAWSNHPKR
ncbi:MAG TPA: hypothetical protein VGC72_08610 [Candidatus Elarobacter sp.]